MRRRFGSFGSKGNESNPTSHSQDRPGPSIAHNAADSPPRAVPHEHSTEIFYAAAVVTDGCQAAQKRQNPAGIVRTGAVCRILPRLWEGDRMKIAPDAPKRPLTNPSESFIMELSRQIRGVLFLRHQAQFHIVGKAPFSRATTRLSGQQVAILERGVLYEW